MDGSKLKSHPKGTFLTPFTAHPMLSLSKAAHSSPGGPLEGKPIVP